MGKTVLVFSMTTAAGAGTYASTLISENGQVKNLAGWTAPRKMAITKITPMGANGDYSCFARSDHPSDNITFVHPADTLADYDKVIDVVEMFGGKAGIIINPNEGLSLTNTVTGNATINVQIELDDSITAVNARAIRIAGANAFVANVPTETGGNVAANLKPNSAYRVRSFCFQSTSIQMAYAMLKGNSCSLPGANAVLTGQGYTALTDEQAGILEGSGAEFTNTFLLYATGTAADAANVQDIYIFMEAS